jgi:hypothetical protein
MKKLWSIQVYRVKAGFKVQVSNSRMTIQGEGGSEEEAFRNAMRKIPIPDRPGFFDY